MTLYALPKLLKTLRTFEVAFSRAYESGLLGDKHSEVFLLPIEPEDSGQKSVRWPLKLTLASSLRAAISLLSIENYPAHIHEGSDTISCER